MVDRTPCKHDLGNSPDAPVSEAPFSKPLSAAMEPNRLSAQPNGGTGRAVTVERCVALQDLAIYVHDAVALCLAAGGSRCPDIARGPSLRPSGIRTADNLDLSGGLRRLGGRKSGSGNRYLSDAFLSVCLFPSAQFMGVSCCRELKAKRVQVTPCCRILVCEMFWGKLFPFLRLRTRGSAHIKWAASPTEMEGARESRQASTSDT